MPSEPPWGVAAWCEPQAMLLIQQEHRDGHPFP